MVIKIIPNEFRALSKYILEKSGIALEPGKEYLVESRLSPVLGEFQCKSYSELYHKATVDSEKIIEKKIVDAISTNETYFFRDAAPFELLQHKIVPDVIDNRSAKSKMQSPMQLRIWSAASSTGQELYSIAIILKELYLDQKKFDIKLLGTDISNTVIAKASYGSYNKFEISRGLPPAKVQKYFNKDGDQWRIKDEIRAMAMFKKLNLMEPFSGIGKFDIIFFRNVAIYFTPQDRKKLYEKIARVLEPNGYLIIGATESLANDTDLYTPNRYLRSIFYQLKR